MGTYSKIFDAVLSEGFDHNLCDLAVGKGVVASSVALFNSANGTFNVKDMCLCCIKVISMLVLVMMSSRYWNSGSTWSLSISKPAFLWRQKVLSKYSQREV